MFKNRRLSMTILITTPVALISLYPLMVRVVEPVVNGQILIFEYNSKNNTFTDKQTGNQWNFDGRSIKGQMKGNELLRLPFDEGFWFEWAAFHPKTEVYNAK
jgi:Protein of unknown function (DUF3179)